MKRVYAYKFIKLLMGDKDQPEEVRQSIADEYLSNVVNVLYMIHNDDKLDNDIKYYLINRAYDYIRVKFNLPNKVFAFGYDKDDNGNMSNITIVLFNIEPNTKMCYNVIRDKDKNSLYIELDE